MRELGGVCIVMQTPFTEGLDIDWTSLEREVAFLVKCKVHGLVWPVDASELDTLSHDERLEATAHIVRNAGDLVPVIVGISAPNIRESVEFARHAEQSGAKSVILIPPTEKSGGLGPELLIEGQAGQVGKKGPLSDTRLLVAFVEA